MSPVRRNVVSESPRGSGISTLRCNAMSESPTGSGVTASTTATGGDTCSATVFSPLAPGMTALVGEYYFRISCVLGKGSFGTVWLAEAQNGRKVAIKELVCHSQRDVKNAEFECQCLREFSNPSGKGLQGNNLRIPSFIAMDRFNLSAGGSDATDVVLLAMAYAQGQTLSDYVAKQKSSLGFFDACRFVRQLLLQLTPTLEHIAAKVYHRDINPRNILVEQSEHGPIFTLIDFGLAVDAERWHRQSRFSRTGDDGSGAWFNESVAGDPRFWPASAWAVFAGGVSALEDIPGLCEEYKVHLDFHALGITALQVLEELSGLRVLDDLMFLPGKKQDMPNSESVTFPACSMNLVGKLHDLQAAWQTYREHSVQRWRGIYDAFCTGNTESIQQKYLTEGVHHTIRKDLCLLRKALRAAHQSCEAAPPDSGLEDAAVLFLVFHILIRSGDNLSGTPSWRTIRAILTRHTKPTDAAGGTGGSPEEARRKMKEAFGNGMDAWATVAGA